MTLSLLINAALCLLLAATIVVGLILIRRLGALRAAQGELAAMGEIFVAATAKAEAGLAELRKTAEADGEALQDRVASARGLKDDLTFLIDRAEAAADRLERAIGQSRTAGQGPRPAARREPTPYAASSGQASHPGAPSDVPPPRLGGQGLPPAGRDLLRALQGVR